MNARISPSIAADYAKAAAYLRTSPTGARLVDAFEDTHAELDPLLDHDFDDATGVAWDRSRHQYDSPPVISWNPHGAQGLREGRESPALALAHEMQHVLQYEKHETDGTDPHEPDWFDRALGNYGEDEEDAARVEARIARELPDEPVRANYADGTALEYVRTPITHSLNATGRAARQKAKAA